MTAEVQLKEGARDNRQPTSRWHLMEFKKGEYYEVYDENEKPVRLIKGPDARLLKRILTCKNETVPEDAVRAFRPLFAEVFSNEFDLSDEGETYRQELTAGQPRIHPRESEEEVYRRYWTGTLMPAGISARDLAEKIVKSEPRVQVGLIWKSVLVSDLPQKIDWLAEVIKMYHPRGIRGR